MTEETVDAVENPEDVETDEQQTVDTESSVGSEESQVAADEHLENVNTPEFAELKPGNASGSSNGTDMNRLHDVQVSVSAELGRIQVSIQELLLLSEGSVFELNRSIDSPVELIAQGVPLGNGEVVVVDGNFAIRIREIYAKQ